MYSIWQLTVSYPFPLFSGEEEGLKGLRGRWSFYNSCTPTLWIIFLPNKCESGSNYKTQCWPRSKDRLGDRLYCNILPNLSVFWSLDCYWTLLPAYYKQFLAQTFLEQQQQNNIKNKPLESPYHISSCEALWSCPLPHVTFPFSYFIVRFQSQCHQSIPIKDYILWIWWWWWCLLGRKMTIYRLCKSVVLIIKLFISNRDLFIEQNNNNTTK